MKRLAKTMTLVLALSVLFTVSFPLTAEAAAMKMNKSKITVNVGKNYKLKVKNTKKKAKWKSSNKKIATVSASGIVKAKKSGTTVVSAKIGKKTLKCRVTVKKAKKHAHSWKNHYANKKVWVPDIVTVPDYKTVTKTYRYCECGATFEFSDTSASSPEGYSEHVLKNIFNGGCTRYSDVTVQEKVQTGSHKEDRGKYKTTSYVDYQYCACGARK